MSVSFEKLEANYVALAAAAHIVPARERSLALACESLIKDKAIYQSVDG
jgi:hypothetical protein